MATEVDAQATLLAGDTIPAADLRRELVASVFPSAGVVSGLHVAALGTPGMKVNVPAGMCLVDDADGGLYPLYLETATELDIGASSSSLARIDSVIAEVVDTGVAATLIRRFRVIAGTAGSSVAPTLPPADQPTAKTLRLANVNVRANAETSGNIRSQDITTIAATTSVVQRPQSTDLVSTPSFSGTSVWTDFTSGQWPRVTLDVPASGAVIVTISAGNIANKNTSNSTIRIAYRISGSDTVSADPLDSKCVLNTQASEISASRTTYIDGLTPAGRITVTPQWRISSGTSSDITFSAGSLIVQPVA